MPFLSLLSLLSCCCWWWWLLLLWLFCFCSVGPQCGGPRLPAWIIVPSCNFLPWSATSTGFQPGTGTFLFSFLGAYLSLDWSRLHCVLPSALWLYPRIKPSRLISGCWHVPPAPAFLCLPPYAPWGGCLLGWWWSSDALSCLLGAFCVLLCWPCCESLSVPVLYTSYCTVPWSGWCGWPCHSLPHPLIVSLWLLLQLQNMAPKALALCGDLSLYTISSAVFWLH